MAKILIADDTKAIADIVGNILGKQSHEVDIVYNGTDAIKKIDTDNYDLLITDMLMPGHDGFEVIAHIKKLERKTKIIVMTGGGVSITPNEIIRNVGDDISTYLIKPIGKTELLDAVNKVLG